MSVAESVALGLGILVVLGIVSLVLCLLVIAGWADERDEEMAVPVSEKVAEE